MYCTQYLKGLINITSGKQKDFFQFVLDNSKYYTKEKRPKLESINLVKPLPKSCYRNSILGTVVDNAEYVEGFYLTDIGVVLSHAFNIKNGKVIDYTSNLIGIKVKERFGVVVPKKIITKYINTEQRESVLKFYYRYEKN